VTQVDGDGATYDQQVWFYRRVIAYCEIEKARLRGMLVVLTMQLIIAELTFASDEVIAEIQEQMDAIEQQIRELDALEEAARRALAQLKRDHGPTRWARADSPESGAQKAYYTGAGTGAQR
jgi:hypothetical protein